MKINYIRKILDEGLAEEGSVELAFNYLLEEWIRELFGMNDWDEPTTTVKTIKWNGVKYQINIMEDGCCEATNEHRIMYWKHTIKIIE